MMMTFKKRLKAFFVLQFYRWQIAMTFMMLVNFSLLVLTASDKLRLIIPMPDTFTLVIVFIPSMFFLTWLYGYILDKKIRYAQTYMSVQNARNQELMRILSCVEDMNKRLEKIENKMGGHTWEK